VLQCCAVRCTSYTMLRYTSYTMLRCAALRCAVCSMHTYRYA
jgi:hypothetical protein